MEMNKNQKQVTEKKIIRRLNRSHIQGFIAGFLIMAILAFTGLFVYISNDRNSTSPGGMPRLQYNQYVRIEDFDKEVLNAPGQTLVYFNDSSLSFDRLTRIYDNIYENNGMYTKTYYATEDTYDFIEGLGISKNDLPCFAMFENGKLLGSHKLDLKEVSVMQWLAPFNQPRIYRAFPSSAYDSVGDYYQDGYYISELCLMPEEPGLRGFIKLSDNMTMPLQQNTVLYALLTDKFGGDNKTYFGLPNLEAQIPAAGLRYFMAGERNLFPERDYNKNLVSYVDGNIKYLEFSINDINQSTYIGQVILAKNVDEEKYSNLMLPCDGRMLSVNKYASLAQMLGNKFGGDGINNFKLPDLSKVDSAIKGAKYYILLQSLYPSID